jgi:hypothetical protein
MCESKKRVIAVLCVVIGMSLPLKAAYLVEVDIDGLDDGVLVFSPDFSFGGDTTDNFTDPVLFVTRLVFETPAAVKWTSWLNPELDESPADIDAFSEDTHSVSYINTIRIAGQSGVVFDELRIGTTYDDVSPIPEPASLGLVVLFACGTCFVRRVFMI